jgi:hypothetical protein
MAADAPAGRSFASRPNDGRAGAQAGRRGGGNAAAPMPAGQDLGGRPILLFPNPRSGVTPAPATADAPTDRAPAAL